MTCEKQRQSTYQLCRESEMYLQSRDMTITQSSVRFVSIILRQRLSPLPNQSGKSLYCIIKFRLDFFFPMYWHRYLVISSPPSPLLPHPTDQSYQFHSVQSYSTVTSSSSTPSKHNQLLSSPHLIPFSLSRLTSTPFHPCDCTVFHHISYRHFFAEIESQLFKEHECDDGLRSQSDPRW